MEDSFVIRILLILIAAGILIALVVQYKRAKSDDSSATNKESFYVENRAKPRDQQLKYEQQFRPRRVEEESNTRGVAPYEGTMARAKSTSHGSQNIIGAPYNQHQRRKEHVIEEEQVRNITQPKETKMTNNVNNVMPSESFTNNNFNPIDFNTTSKIKPNECFPRERLTAEDLLPKDAANSKWAQVNPAGQGDVQGVNLLNAGFHMGINTVGQTNRNPNLQIRSEPPIPKVDTGPWNQSTIEYDVSRRHFELGEV